MFCLTKAGRKLEAQHCPLTSAQILITNIQPILKYKDRRQAPQNSDRRLFQLGN